MNGGGAVSITGSSSALQATTAMWHLPRSGIKIPPPPDRPAPSPNSAAAAGKTVTFSLSQVNEVIMPGEQVTSNDQERRSCLRQNGGTAGGAGGGGVLPQPLEAPPPPRLTASTSVNLSGTAIPRPIAKRQVSTQPANNSGCQPEQTVVTPMREGERKAPALKRRNSSTNPFLCESTEQIPSNPISEPLNATVASLEKTTISTSECTPITAPLETPNGPISTDTPSTIHHNGNPFVERESLSSRLLKIHNTTNPFTGLSQRVKGPHLLQKTISEDYLFRKLGVNCPMANGNGTGPGSGHVNGNGNGTWSFGRSLLRQDSTLSLGMGLGRRNSSQVSLDSHAGSVPGSMDGINLERAISCDSVTSDSTLFLDQLDQPYTQITGYLCVGLNYDQ